MSGPCLTLDADGTPIDPVLRAGLKALAQRGAKLVSGAGGATIEASRQDRILTVGWLDASHVSALEAADFLTDIGDGRFVLAPTGRNVVRRMKAAPSPADAGAGNAPAAPPIIVAEPEQRSERECSLAWMKARQNKDGLPYLSDEAFAAGERLRADFHRAGMMPRVTVDWDMVPRTADERAGLSGGRGDAGNAGAAERLRRALADLPPELADLVIDVCCFDRRLQAVEKTRSLPRRTGAYLLGVALTILARHYGLLPPAERPWQSSARTRHWGAADYRPTIDGATPKVD